MYPISDIRELTVAKLRFRFRFMTTTCNTCDGIPWYYCSMFRKFAFESLTFSVWYSVHRKTQRARYPFVRRQTIQYDPTSSFTNGSRWPCIADPRHDAQWPKCTSSRKIGSDPALDVGVLPADGKCHVNWPINCAVNSGSHPVLGQHVFHNFALF